MSKQDVLIRAEQGGLYDIQLNDDGTDFATAEGFESAIPVLLFTDARAPSSAVSESKNRRGWIGNIRTLDQNRQLGGLLWLYDQGRVTIDLLNNLRSAAENSLKTLVEDGIITNVNVTPTIDGIRSIRLLIAFKALDNSVDQYSVLWRLTNINKLASKG